MIGSVKRYRCPQCDKVSNGTGIAAHMAASGHTGERIELPDAQHPTDGLGKKRGGGAVAKAAAPAPVRNVASATAGRTRRDVMILTILPFIVAEDEKGTRYLLEKFDDD